METAEVFNYQDLAVFENAFSRLPSGNRVELDGFLTAEFNHTGQCTIFREWWHRQETESSNG